MIPRLCSLLACAALAGGPLPDEGEAQGRARAVRDLQAALSEQGVELDLERGLLALPAEVLVRDDFLEYLLVGSAGASHESLLATPVLPSVLNAAILALGVEPGTNALWTPVDPPPTEDALRAGASPYEVTPPAGDGLYLYVAWREGGETYFYRAEDLVRDLASGRSMRRHAWVYLGSQMVPSERGGTPDTFAADLYQNLINISFFTEGYTLLTGALAECLNQTTWVANAWLLPERGTAVTLLLSRRRLTFLPEEWVARVAALGPELAGPEAPVPLPVSADDGAEPRR